MDDTILDGIPFGGVNDLEEIYQNLNIIYYT
jgi:hypothetical protein